MFCPNLEGTGVPATTCNKTVDTALDIDTFDVIAFDVEIVTPQKGVDPVSRPTRFVSGAGLAIVGGLLDGAYALPPTAKPWVSALHLYDSTEVGMRLRLSAAVLGLWVTVAPFVFGVDTAAMWNDVIVCAVVVCFNGLCWRWTGPAPGTTRLIHGRHVAAALALFDGVRRQLAGGICFALGGAKVRFTPFLERVDYWLK